MVSGFGGRRRRRFAVVATTLALCVAAPAAADDFLTCDGYAAPERKADNMSATFVWGPFSSGAPEQQTDRPAFALGKAAIAPCTAALRDPRLLPQFWRRRVNLLRARAIHKLAIDDVPGALADLDAAEAAAQDPGDVYYRRSLKFGIDLLRAYARRESSDNAGAIQIAEAAWAQRPYDRQSAMSAMLALGADPAFEKQLDGLLTRLARVNPDYIDAMFFRALERRRYEEAVALYPQLVQPKRYGRPTVNPEIYWASRSGSYAYALAALGRDDDARAAVEASRVRLAKATEPPSAVPLFVNADQQDRDRYAKKREAEIQVRDKLRSVAQPLVDNAATLVDQRLRVAHGDAAKVLQELAADKPSKSFLRQDLSDAAMAKTGAIPPPMVWPSTAQIVGVDSVDDRKSLKGLLGTLPASESPERLTPIRRTDWLSIAGFSISKPDARGAVQISFRSVDGTKSMVEEMAMLSAAQQALKAGKKGFVVVERLDYKHITQNMQYGVVVSETFTGYETKLFVRYVDPEALPEDLKGAGWRVIDARAVSADLTPIYAPAPQAKGKA